VFSPCRAPHCVFYTWGVAFYLWTFVLFFFFFFLLLFPCEVFFLLFIYKIYITFGCDFIFGLWTLVFFSSLVGCFFFTYLFIYKHTGVVIYLDFGPFIFRLLLFPCGAVFPLFIYLFINIRAWSFIWTLVLSIFFFSCSLVGAVFPLL
jgi:hypothetical protein